MPTFETVLFQGGFALFTAVIAAWITVRLALRRFYQEKWWEAKMQAYTQVIQALHHMKWDVDVSIAAEIGESEPDTEFHKELDEKHRLAWHEIRRQSDIGDFLFSRESLKILRELNDLPGQSPNDSYLDHLEIIQAAVNKAMPAIKKAARSDLGLPPIGRWRDRLPWKRSKV